MVDVMKKVPVREQNPEVRAKNFEEVCLGYNEEEAMAEASRCLNCKNAMCVKGCPVSINIPAFIHEVKEGNFAEAYRIISESSALPAVCGRVCPQETQCEGKCIRGIKGEAIAIGKLERFVADWARENGISPEAPKEKKGKKVAVIGSGPSGLTCAGDLAKMGYDVTIFEALHKAGGVLVYGIPEFRLPKETVVQAEVENVKKLGVKIETNVIVGKSVRIDELMEDGYEAVFIGSGAGLPRFMGIPGENANGVFSANEYLTRSNLMKAFKDEYDTPIVAGTKVAVVGGGNVAMDAARTALRLGAEVYIVYRRGEDELPARAEEVHHAKEEGIIFNLLTNPTEILVDEKGWVKGMKCIRMELGEADASGRRSPVEVPGSVFEMELDTVIMSLGTSPNPLISSTTKGLDINKRKCIIADENNGQTSKIGVFAGGDAVTGAATVILANISVQNKNKLFKKSPIVMGDFLCYYHIMKIKIICVGKIKEKFYTMAIDEYAKRLSRYCKLEIIEVADEKTPDGCSEVVEAQIKAKEGERINNAIKEDDYVISLAINGTKLDSVAFADKIEKLGVNGVSSIAFIIGGSLGLDNNILKRSDYKLSFSDMTFPHQLMRVILCEQIYRCYRIINGEPYHK